MVYVYPTTITTSTGRSTKYGTQAITNKAALCSNSTTLAYWGVKKPTYKGHPLRNYPDSVTTPSGSFYKPEYITASGWTIKDVDQKSIVQKIAIEYKWEQIAYSSKTSFGKFAQPTISIVYKGKTLTSFKGAKPEAIRYNNNTTNKAYMNTNYADLATLHSKTIDISKYNITVKDLPKLKIKFDPAKNTASNHCRIVMQFLRLKVSYQAPPKQEKKETPIVDVPPLYRVTSKITPTESITDKEWTYECTIKSQNTHVKSTTCKLKFSNIQSIEYVSHTTDNKNNTYDPDKKVWTIKTFTNKSAKLILKCKSHLLGTQGITTTVQKYADSVGYETTSNIDIVSDKIDLRIGLIGEQEPYVFNTKGETISKCLRMTLIRDRLPQDNSGKVILNTGSWLSNGDLTISEGTANMTYNDGKWTISNIITERLIIQATTCKEIKPGTYTITADYTETEKTLPQVSIPIHVIGNTLDKEFFKLRLEDGSDVRYNSLMFTPGDDLTIPLTYDIVSDSSLKDHLIITGEQKTIPVNEARYISFTIQLKDTTETYQNIIAYIDVVDENGQNAFDILVASDSNIQLFQGGEHKYCIIDELSPNEVKKIKFVVLSDTERICQIKLKPFNYDLYESEVWTKSVAHFKDMPNLKLSIEADKYDLNTDNNADLQVTYTIENRSTKGFHITPTNFVNVTGYKFKLTEPSSFQIVDYVLPEEDYNDDLAPQFNEKDRTITLPYIQPATYSSNGELITHKYNLYVNYKATERGIYNFKMCTEDNPFYIEDDQYKNCVQKQVLVDIDSNVRIKTFVSKQRPYVNELIDFTIQVKNYTKRQDKFVFNIQDIGAYEIDHNKNDYQIEYANYSNSTFKETENGLGEWTIKNVEIDDEYELVLTLRPLDVGYHVIQTDFSNGQDSVQQFHNLVNVMERNKQISFDVYHAMQGDGDCSKCEQLTPICDEDYINLEDELYYVISVTNNSKNPITETTHIYARIPEKLLPTLCHSEGYNYKYDENTKLISFTIPELKKCENKKICFKVKGNEQGTYISNFMLTNHNAHTYHKQLKIHVNDEFDAHKLEHEIAIYNFEKTNRYFRYELDGDNNIFKFFNQGNRPTKYVDGEQYKQSSIEYYKGSNLKKLLNDIKENSKYVEPELLRIGNNKLTDKGYEIYPDGFIRRFGLLNSEVFHYSHQLPTISNMVEYAMRWEEDMWDNKVWGGGNYDNGIFDLSIDYSRIPTNFDILNIDNPIGKLQALVDKAKPFGTKAICYYNDTIDLKLKTDMNVYNSETENIIPYTLYLSPLELVSLYNLHDNSIAAYYDMFNFTLKNNIAASVSQSYDDDSLTLMTTDLSLYVDIFDQTVNKKYLNECFDIIQNLYLLNTYNNIDIIKKYQYDGQPYNNEPIVMQQNNKYSFAFNDNAKMIINTDNIYTIQFEEQEMNNFKGFVVYKNDEPIFSRNIGNTINSCTIQVETTRNNIDIITDENILHFWVQINNDIYYYHLGYVITNQLQDVVILPMNAESCETINKKTNTDAPIWRGISEENEDEIKEDLVSFAISNNIHTTTISAENIVQSKAKYQWKNMYKFFFDKGYTLFENNSEVDTDCANSYRSVPLLAIQYDNLKINSYDEITDIAVKLKANTNKKDFIDDLAIELRKDGKGYLPNNNIGMKTYYPKKITNVYEDYVNTISIQQPNITICSSCLKTSLGYYDQCPYCESDLVSHYNEKKSVTICYACGYIENGWNEYCTHCLSNDVEKTLVDYNKTYCNTCGSLEDDYYTHCPKCFSSDVVHLNNDEHRYYVQSDSTQNINPIVVKSDVERINLCNITLPFNMDTLALKQYEYLMLHIDGTNHNDGKFYYCPLCGAVGLGNVDKCEACDSQNVQNYTFDNITMDIYTQIGETYRRIDTDTEYDQLKGNFNIGINIKDIAENNTNESEFQLMFYAENILYDQILSTINKLDIDEDARAFLQKNILNMNITIDNIYYDNKPIDSNEWQGLDQLEGINHSGIEYTVQNEEETDYISFSNFNLDHTKYEHLYLNIDGINKSHSNIIMHLLVLDKNQNVLYNSEQTEEEIGDYNISINPDLFRYTEDLTTLIEHSKVPLISKIKIAFKNITEPTDLKITGCNMIGEFEQFDNILDIAVEQGKNNVVQDGINYLITSSDNFGLNDTLPYYIDGKQLKTGLVCFIDFGKVNANEYIRLYDVELIVSYKNKYGQLITEAIDNMDNKYTECLVNGNIQKYNGDNWTSIKTSISILNNLEYEIINDNDEDSLSAIPLKSTLAQAFTLTENNIGAIILDYFGQVGSPNKDIIVELYDDYKNTPYNLISSKNITLPNTLTNMTIDFNIDNLESNEQYWIMLKDPNADEYNYHRFRYNGNLSIGNLIIDKEHDQNRVLCLSVESNMNAYESYLLPMTVEDELDSSFKVAEQLYRYNINNGAVIIDNISIQTGYREYLEDEAPEKEESITYEEIDEEEISYDEDNGDADLWN